MTDRIYIVTDRIAAGDRFFEILKSLISEGFNFIQLREKDLSAVELYDMGEKIMKMRKGVKLVINDRLDVALALGAYGVHLAEKSLTPDVMQGIRGSLKIGLSIHDGKRLQKYENYCDFFVFGNVFETDCKPGVTGKGAGALKEIAGLTPKPVYAIGGINGSNAGRILNAGAYGAAVRSAVFSSKDPLRELKRIKEIFRSVHGKK